MLQVKKKQFFIFFDIFVGLHPDLSTSDVSVDPKMTKKLFCEDSHVVYHFVQNFKEIKDYIGTYNFLSYIQ